MAHYYIEIFNFLAEANLNAIATFKIFPLWTETLFCLIFSLEFFTFQRKIQSTSFQDFNTSFI